MAKQRFGEIRTVGQTASALYAPFMKSLQDQVTFLGHDLNSGSPRSPAVRAAGLDLLPRHCDAEALPGRDVMVGVLGVVAEITAFQSRLDHPDAASHCASRAPERRDEVRSSDVAS